MPIAFQDHGNPVRYRNVWVRELGEPRHKEFMLPDAVLESYVGTYGQGQWNTAQVRRMPDGQLSFTLAGSEVVLHAESPTQFYALTTDVRCRFDLSGAKKTVTVTVGESDEHAMTLERVTP
jgi:hypothetical protein